MMKTIQELQELIRGAENVVLRGGGTKSALSCGKNGAEIVDMSGMSGILEYDPSEFTFTALAGTRLSEINAALAENDQYLPFDPPFASEGATLGGTLAAGLSGPRRLRFGGIRDFVIGIKYVNGEGVLISGGGKVVKNAAGYDLPKLFTGSLGLLGAVVEISFKVFPMAASLRHVVFDTGSLLNGIALQERIALSAWEPDALDLEPCGRLHLTLAGDAVALSKTLDRIDAPKSPMDSVFQPIPDDAPVLVKLPITADKIVAIDAGLEEMGIRRNYSVAGNVAWLGLDEAAVGELDAYLRSQNLRGLVLRRAEFGEPYLGAPLPELAEKIRTTLDPRGVFFRG